jgi:hypothetical protein
VIDGLGAIAMMHIPVDHGDQAEGHGGRDWLRWMEMFDSRQKPMGRSGMQWWPAGRQRA